MEDENVKFFSMIREYIHVFRIINWYRPKVDFMSDKTQIWKFEKGLMMSLSL